MNHLDIFEILNEAAFRKDWFGNLVLYPLGVQLALLAGVVLFFGIKPLRLKRRKAGRDIVYSLRTIEVRIDTLSESPIVLVRDGRKVFHATAVGFDCNQSDLEAQEAITETVTGTTSGGLTLDGKYVLPQTITLNRPTGRYYTRKVGTRASISFVTLNGKNTSRKFSGVSLYSDAQKKKFESLWRQLLEDLESVNKRFLP